MFEVNEEWCWKVKILKLKLLFAMASRGHSAKKKKDTFNNSKEESKDPKPDEAMDFQPNIIRNEKPEE